MGGRGGGEVGGAGAGEGGVGGSRQGGGTRGGSWARHNRDSKSVVVGQTPPLRLLQDVLWVVHADYAAAVAHVVADHQPTVVCVEVV